MEKINYQSNTQRRRWMGTEGEVYLKGDGLKGVNKEKSQRGNEEGKLEYIGKRRKIRKTNIELGKKKKERKYIYIIRRERERDRQTYRETDKLAQRGRERDRHTNIHRDRQREVSEGTRKRKAA